MIVILAKLDPRRQEIALEKYTEGRHAPRDGATNTRQSCAILGPICRQKIQVKKNLGLHPATYNVVPKGALVLEFQLLFLHQADLSRGERDIRIEASDLQKWANVVWGTI